jgi:tetratricopeptide (TPR) repeat protein
MRNSKLALVDCDQAIRYSPTADNYLNRALACSDLKRYSDAINAYSKAISLEPKALAYSGRASAYLNLGQIDKAWPDLDKAIILEPDFILARKLRAQAFLSIKRPTKALEEVAKVDRLNIDLYPRDNLEFEEVRYHAHEQMENWSAVVADLQGILREFPSERWATSKLRQAQMMGGSSKAKQSGEHSGTSSSSGSSANLDGIHDAISHIKLAREARKFGKFDTAIKEANIAISLDPQSCDAYLERGWAYRDSLQTEKARADFENAALIDSKNPSPLEALGKLYRKLKDYQLSLKYYSKAIPLSKYEDIYVARSETYFLAGKYKESLQDAEQALKRNPRSVSAMAARANANVALNQPAKAMPDLDFLIKFDPEKEDYLLLRAKAYEKLGQTAFAAKDRKAVQDHSRDLFDNAPFRTKKGE